MAEVYPCLCVSAFLDFKEELKKAEKDAIECIKEGECVPFLGGVISGLEDIKDCGIDVDEEISRMKKLEKEQSNEKIIRELSNIEKSVEDKLSECVRRELREWEKKHPVKVRIVGFSEKRPYFGEKMPPYIKKIRKNIDISFLRRR